MKKILFSLFVLFVIIYFTNCTKAQREYKITDIRIYKNTDVWELAQAVNKQDTLSISLLAQKNPNLLDYKDPVYGTTLLVWAVGNEKYQSAKALLKNGADPNVISDYVGGTALYLASGYSWVDTNAHKDPKYVSLLLEFGADPNINSVGTQRKKFSYILDGESIETMIGIGESPLIRSIGSGIEKTKLLINAGAEVNYVTPDGKTAAIYSLIYVGQNSTVDSLKYAYYLIVDKHADITGSYPRLVSFGNQMSKEECYPVELLRGWIFDIDSEKYKIKMEIVDEFMRQGVDYWNSEIPMHDLQTIVDMYPDTWREYIKQY